MNIWTALMIGFVALIIYLLKRILKAERKNSNLEYGIERIFERFARTTLIELNRIAGSGSGLKIQSEVIKAPAPHHFNTYQIEVRTPDEKHLIVSIVFVWKDDPGQPHIKIKPEEISCIAYTLDSYDEVLKIVGDVIRANLTLPTAS